MQKFQKNVKHFLKSAKNLNIFTIYFLCYDPAQFYLNNELEILLSMHTKKSN